MKCPKCDCTESKVQDSRFYADTRRRRRECLECGHRFTTTEIYGIHKDSSMPLFRPAIKKRDNSLEDFDDRKLTASIRLVCERRPLRGEQLDEMLNGLLEQFRAYQKPHIEVAKLIDRVVAEIAQLDKIAALRYACQHKDFASFEQIREYSLDILK